MSGATLYLAHVMFGLLVLVDPVMGVWRRGRLKIPERGRSRARTRFYVSSMALQVIYALAVVVVIFFSRDSASVFGFEWKVSPSGALFCVLFGLLVLIFGPFVVFTRSGREDARDGRETLRRAFEPISAQLPVTRGERRSFAALAVVGGLCEEILFRGFLLYYVSQASAGFLNLPLWGAVIVSGVIFGMAHLHQGLDGVLTMSVIGVLLAATFVLSGSLILPIIIHALANLRTLALWNLISRSQRTL